MKKILLSLSTIGAVAILAVVGTTAYFSDEEKSTGNILVAGALDLKVDHTMQTYNGVDCETCSVDVYSSTATRVVAASSGAAYPAVPYDAVEISNPHPAWQNEAALAPAQWIWASDPTAIADTTNDVEYTFQNKFQWNGSVASVDLDLALAADNGYKIILNGTTIVDKLMTEFNYGAAVPLTGPEETAFIGNMVTNGQNTLKIVVRNKPLDADPVTGNPAGLLFKLNVHRPLEECEADSAFQQTCRLWTEKDLGKGDTFFNFDDVKPGDSGTNVISLHVDNNDAWVCMSAADVVNKENGLTKPEVEIGDTAPDGELGKNINIFMWRDNGNGIYDAGEVAIGSRTLADVFTAPIYDSSTSPLAGNTTAYVGLAWCAGAQTIVGNTISCDGSAMDNSSQSDKVTADLIFRAEQSRHQDGFICPTTPE